MPDDFQRAFTLDKARHRSAHSVRELEMLLADVKAWRADLLNEIASLQTDLHQARSRPPAKEPDAAA